MMKWQMWTERHAAIACLALGVGISAALSPKDSFFLPNFAFFWGTQVLVLVLTLSFHPRPAIVAGVAFALAVYLSLFGSWLFSRAHPESMAWFFYLFSLPGALAGVLLGVPRVRGQLAISPMAAGLSVAAFVSIGIAINLAIVVIYIGHGGAK